jgi:hypothetical protein
MSRARLQLAVAERYHAKLRLLPASDEGLDRLRGFFENCWHIKDHAKSELAPTDAQQLEKDVDGIPDLKIVADLANRSKHVVLTKRDRTGASFAVKEIQAFDGGSSRSAEAEYQVSLADGSVHRALDIADRALAHWARVLPKYGLW